MVWNNRIQSRRTHITWCAPCCRTKTYPTKKNILKPPQKQTQPNCKPTKKKHHTLQEPKKHTQPNPPMFIRLELISPSKSSKKSPKKFSQTSQFVLPLKLTSYHGHFISSDQELPQEVSSFVVPPWGGFSSSYPWTYLGGSPHLHPRKISGWKHVIMEVWFRSFSWQQMGWFVGSSR